MFNPTSNCYQPSFTVLNEYQILLQISGGTITRLEQRPTPKPPSYLAICRDGKEIYFEDLISGEVPIYEPVSLALFHQVCNLFCQMAEESQL
jgi:hypothetical protein